MASKKAKKGASRGGAESAPRSAKKGRATAAKKGARAGAAPLPKRERNTPKRGALVGKAKKGAKKGGRTVKATKVAKAKRSTKAPVRPADAVRGPSGAKKVATKRGTAGARQPSRRKAAGELPQRQGIRRRDGAGHIDPSYAADLLARRGASDRDDKTSGFVTRPRSIDPLAENLGEEFVESATSGENQEEEILEREVPEELGGPFVETSSKTEFADGTDASNPKGAKREPFPTT
jgi:hypothetical protein